jgi:hypothetical protein
MLLVSGVLDVDTGQVRMTRFTNTGELDPTFGFAGAVVKPVDQYVPARLVVQPDGKILLATSHPVGVTRYLMNGDVDTPFGENGVLAIASLQAILAMAFGPDGALWIAGASSQPSGPVEASWSGDAAVMRFTGEPVAAIEFYDAGQDHYFVSSNPQEVGALDLGVFSGWSRSGQSFRVYADTPAGSVDVCRFFSTAFAPKSSHFYTPDANECNSVKANPDWQFEGVVFGTTTPDSAGNCPNGTQPVYRLYNNGQGGAPNHRYTTSLPIRSQMLLQAWIPEGYGAVGVIMCSPT